MRATTTAIVATVCLAVLFTCGCGKKVDKKRAAMESLRSRVDMSRQIRLGLKGEMTFGEFETKFAALRKEYAAVDTASLPTEVAEDMQLVLDKLNALQDDWKGHKNAKPSDEPIIKVHTEIVRLAISAFEMRYLAANAEMTADELSR